MRTSEPLSLRTLLAAAAIMIFLSLIAHGRAFGATESVLHSFLGYPVDGNWPYNGLIKDANCNSNCNLYGTTYYGGNNHYFSSLGDGAVFKLVPNGFGGWTESIIYNFGSGVDGVAPFAGLFMDPRGNLYGTTQRGGTTNGGTVFELSPNGSGGWSETFLYSFGSVGGDGSFPRAGLTMDTGGNLYGATSSGGAGANGTVFELLPNGTGGYSETVLYSFGSGGDAANPYGTLLRDSIGNLYGVTAGGGTSGLGTAFELSPPTSPGTIWTEKVLWSFGTGTDGAGPEASLIMDALGNLYGTTLMGGAYDDHKPLNSDVGGTAFKLTRPVGAGNWTETVLWNFGYTAKNGKVVDGRAPERSLLLVGGSLYGTAMGGGTKGGGIAFKLNPPSGSGSAWTETILWNFAGGADGSGPHTDLISIDSTTNLYGTTLMGGTNNIGTVFKITP